MTEVTFNKKAFLETLHVLQTQFNLVTPAVQLATEPSGERFSLTAKRDDDQNVGAFGPCEVKGDPISVEFDIKDLEAAIIDAHGASDVEKVTLLVANGVWVKDPAPEAL
jgi:hypothetical protein